jgi:Phytanoyl-CoA dioxygenase (PhyH)
MLARVDVRDRDSALTAVARDGCVVLGGVWARAAIERARDAYVAWIGDAERSGRGGGMPVGDGRLLVPVELRGALGDPDVVVCPRIAPLCEALLGGDWIVNSFASVVAVPGAGAQPRHKDHDFLFDAAVAATLPCWAVTLVVPLVDLNDATGTTAVVLGSHRRDDADARDVEVAPAMAMGDALLMDYRLSHFGTPNRSPRVRPVLYAVYSRPWFLDERNFHQLPRVLAPPSGLAQAIRARVAAVPTAVVS